MAEDFPRAWRCRDISRCLNPQGGQKRSEHPLEDSGSPAADKKMSSFRHDQRAYLGVDLKAQILVVESHGDRGGVFQRSSAISGPRAVRGVEQGSLTVRCQYDPRYERYVKWWCRGAAWNNCRFVVKTTGSEKEVKEGRVSIRDNQKDRSFTVTMKELRLDDSDTYWCGIEIPGPDLGNPVEVTIDPGKRSIFTRPTTNANMFTAPVAPEGHLSGGQSLRSSVHFLLLVFLKVPLFLGMLGAVLWVNRPLRSSGGKPQEHQQPPCSSTFPEQKTLEQKKKAFFSGNDSVSPFPAQPLAFFILRPPTQEKLQEGMEERMPSSGPSSLEDIYDLKSVSHTT
ncbi:TPA: CD300 molecule-like family member d-like [Bos taurus]|nr:TPA: CD300 molecule-like family member d-like [Bos taurus]